MNFSFEQLALKKRYPLRISRGETTGSVNLFVSVESGGVVGWGVYGVATGVFSFPGG